MPVFEDRRPLQEDGTSANKYNNDNNDSRTEHLPGSVWDDDTPPTYEPAVFGNYRFGSGAVGDEEMTSREDAAGEAHALRSSMPPRGAGIMRKAPQAPQSSVSCSTTTSNGETNSAGAHANGHVDVPIGDSASRRRSVTMCIPIPDLEAAGPATTDLGDGATTPTSPETGGNDSSPKQKTLKDIFMHITSHELAPRQRFHHIMHGTPALSPDAQISFVYNIAILVIVIVSTIAVILETLPELYEPDNDSGLTWTYILEGITVGFFTLDYLLRVASANSWTFIFRPMTLVDLASVVGFYIEAVISGSTGQSTGDSGAFLLLRFLRLARIFRLFKIARSHRGLQLMTQVVIKSRDGLVLLMILVGIATLFFSSVLYYVELTESKFDVERSEWVRPDGVASPFQSIPHTFWFISVSITTVGYGEQVPYTQLGRGVSMIVMLFGVLVLSFPNILIGSNFQDAHRNLHRNKARKKFGIWFRRVRMVVRFIRMWREFRVSGKLKSLAMPESGGHVGGISPSKRRNSYDLYLAAKPGGRNASFMTSAIPSRSVNFLFRSMDYMEYKFAETDTLLQRGNLSEVSVGGATALDLMRRVLEGFSSSCSFDELCDSYMFYPPAAGRKVMREALFELCLRCASGGLLQVFVLSRQDGSAVLTLSKAGCDALQHFAEGNPMPCVRCYSDARSLWFQTSKIRPANLLPMEGYQQWQSIEKTVPRHAPFEFVHDLTRKEARNNHIFKVVPPHHALATQSMFERDTNASGFSGDSGRGVQFQPMEPSSRCGSVHFGPRASRFQLQQQQQTCHCRHCVLVQSAQQEHDRDVTSLLTGLPGVGDPGADPTSSSYRGVGDAQGRAFHFDEDEEYLMMQVRIAQNALDLFRLERDLRQLAVKVEKNPSDEFSDGVRWNANGGGGGGAGPTTTRGLANALNKLPNTSIPTVTSSFGNEEESVPSTPMHKFGQQTSTSVAQLGASDDILTPLVAGKGEPPLRSDSTNLDGDDLQAEHTLVPDPDETPPDDESMQPGSGRAGGDSLGPAMPVSGSAEWPRQQTESASQPECVLARVHSLPDAVQAASGGKGRRDRTNGGVVVVMQSNGAHTSGNASPLIPQRPKPPPGGTPSLGGTDATPFVAKSEDDASSDEVDDDSGGGVEPLPRALSNSTGFTAQTAFGRPKKSLTGARSEGHLGSP